MGRPMVASYGQPGSAGTECMDGMLSPGVAAAAATPVFCIGARHVQKAIKNCVQ
jgi:hypothetical protein